MENNSQSAIKSQLLISSSFYAIIQPQMTARSANWTLFKQFKRFLPYFHVVTDICMKTNPTLDNWKIVARMLSFKIVWIVAHSHPLKRTNAQKTPPAQDTQQRLRHIWKKGSHDTKDNMTAKQMSSSVEDCKLSTLLQLFSSYQGLDLFSYKCQLPHENKAKIF